MKCSYIFKTISTMNKIFRACFKTTIEESACYSTKPIYLLDFVCLLVDYHSLLQQIFKKNFNDQRKRITSNQLLLDMYQYLT